MGRPCTISQVRRANNIAVRKLGVEKGLKINEYGVFKDKERVAGSTEKEVYQMVYLPISSGTPGLTKLRWSILDSKKGKTDEIQ
jgi:DNA polymerase (family 10)